MAEKKVLLEKVACAICGTDDTRLIYKGNLTACEKSGKEEFACTNTSYGRFNDIVQCRHCGLIYVNPREAGIVENYKEVVDTLYLDEETGRRLTFENSLKGIERLKRKGSVLDVGCYTGFFLATAKRHGWEIKGIEPCVWASEYARNTLDIDVHTGTLKSAPFAPRSFDVITMWDFLEHVANPKEELLLSKELLKDDGLLVLTTINIKSLIARIMGKRWPQLMRMHTYYYSPNSIKRLLEKYDFEVFNIAAHKRIVRWPYFVSKIEHVNVVLYIFLKYISRFFSLNGRTITIDFGDIMTVYAKKKNL